MLYLHALNGKRKEFMGKVNFIEYKGKKILHIDMSNCLENDAIAIIEESQKIIRTQAPKSVLTLTDVTHTRYNAAVVAAFQEYAKNNKPHVKAAAIIGINAIKKIIFNKIMEFSEREIIAFDNPEKAKEWLAGF
jgi:Icc-related predicted phosphoesterase